MENLTRLGLLLLMATASFAVQHGRKSFEYQRVRKEDSDYVTQEDFNMTMTAVQNQITSLGRRMDKFDTSLQDLKTAVDGDVTFDDFKQNSNVIEGQINSVSTKLDLLDTDYKTFKGSVDKDYCSDSPCKNQGTCENRLYDYQCHCKSTFGGKNCEHEIGMQNSKILEVDNGGPWGDWSLWELCPQGAYARTFRIRLEEPGGDDTAMDNIELMCHHAVTGTETSIKTGNDMWGTWRSWQDCPKGEYMVGFKLKVEEPQDGDDSAANGITSTCTKGTTKTGDIGEWGEFGSTSKCPDGHSICGLQVKQEPDQGNNHDDSALNDIRFLCCASF